GRGAGRRAGVPGEDRGVREAELRRVGRSLRMFPASAPPPRSERRQADLAEVARRARVLVEGRARRQKVTLVTDLPPEPVPLLIDPEQIQQVLVNLLINALDAMPRGGTLQLSVVRGSSSLVPDPQPLATDNGPRTVDQVVEVRVLDTGPGIAPRIRERLFEPFVSSKENGVGLGLSICKRLIEAHGGRIQGSNDPEGGAVFSFT